VQSCLSIAAHQPKSTDGRVNDEGHDDCNVHGLSLINSSMISCAFPSKKALSIEFSGSF
jgi:hypothetical protein